MRKAADNGMERPGILKIGNNYFLKSFAICIDIKETCLVSSIAYLVALFYTLNCKYPSSLTTLYVFLEHIFGIPPSRKSNPAKKLYGELRQS